MLAALIIHALWHIIVARKLKQIRLESRIEFLLGVLTFFGVLLTDVLEGMMMGLLASLVWFIYKSTRPHLASLGRAPGPDRRLFRRLPASGERRRSRDC